MSTKIMVCMVNNVQKNGRIYYKGDKRETLETEPESVLWKSLEHVERAQREEKAVQLEAESIKTVKKLQDENAKLRLKLKEATKKKEDK